MFMAGGGKNIQEELADFFGTGSDKAQKTSGHQMQT